MLLLCDSATMVPSKVTCISVMLLVPLACAETCTGEFTVLPAPGEEMAMVMVSAALELAASTFDPPPPMHPLNSSGSGNSSSKNNLLRDSELKEERERLQFNQSRSIVLPRPPRNPGAVAAYRDWPNNGKALQQPLCFRLLLWTFRRFVLGWTGAYVFVRLEGKAEYLDTTSPARLGRSAEKPGQDWPS